MATPSENAENVTETALDATITLTSNDLSIWGLFLEADLVVKFVMLMLIMASIWSWAIIFEKIRSIRREFQLADDLEYELNEVGAIDQLYDQHAKDNDGIMASVVSVAMFEWRRALARGAQDKGLLLSLNQRIERSMSVEVSKQIKQLEKGMTFLASVGSVAPFVGLFGTVWGIMNSFQSIAQSKNTSLAVVAPGIAEALFATALGLAAAIPAVVAYNRFSSQIENLAERLETFSAELSIIFSRDLDER
ncbi:MAG: protein TolQ [Alphaproteobacteria bacterium]|jgi:biopolymer transport protein TolQ|nr:protein TolQ [Alphaproteobacteria bacterium]